MTLTATGGAGDDLGCAAARRPIDGEAHSVSTALPPMHDAGARFRVELAGYLSGLAIGGQPAHVEMRDADPVDRSAPLIWMANQVGLRVDHVCGERPMIRDDQPDGALRALDRAEPALDALERALGLVLDPVALGPHPPNPGGCAAPPVSTELLVRWAGGPGDAVNNQIALILPSDVRLRDRAINSALVQAARALSQSRLPIILRPMLDGPRLSIADAARLEPGDVVILGPGPARGSLLLPDGSCTFGHFDLAAATFSCAVPPFPRRLVADGVSPMNHAASPSADRGEVNRAAGATDANADGGAASSTVPGATAVSTADMERVARFAVPTEIALQEQSVPLADLAALVPGAVLPLDDRLDEAEVAIKVGGQPIAYGHLIRVGDTHAVMVDRLTPARSCVSGAEE